MSFFKSIVKSVLEKFYTNEWKLFLKCAKKTLTLRRCSLNFTSEPWSRALCWQAASLVSERSGVTAADCIQICDMLANIHTQTRTQRPCQCAYVVLLEYNVIRRPRWNLRCVCWCGEFRSPLLSNSLYTFWSLVNLGDWCQNSEQRPHSATL